MRQGQQNNKRMRGRNRKGPNPLTRSYESNGGDVKIRGTALHVAEKYVQLARDAQSSGDRVAGENYLQHAEHYYRIVAAAQAQMPQPQPVFRSDDDSDEEEGFDNRNAYAGNNNLQGGNFGGNRQPMQGGGQQHGGGQPGEQPPYVNGNNGGGNGGGPEQPQYDDQPGEQRPEPRSEGYDNRGQGGGGHGQGGQGYQGSHFRRRRRPYREHYNDRGGEQQHGQGGGPEPVDTGPADQQGDE
jgi:hypothetical protein